MSAGRTRLISMFGTCTRCVRVALACFAGSLLLCVAVLLFSEAGIYRIGSLLLVLFFTALTSMHIAGWTLRKYWYSVEIPQSSRGCGCHSVPSSDS